jgi:hypothetical protein
VECGSAINTNKLETAGSTNTEANVLLFATFKTGGLGGSDIWISRKLPTGEWGTAENLGPEINTPYNEDFPIISDDGKTLYFASEGHKSMGGFDVFKSTYDTEKGTWSIPQNLGYPINDTYNNMVVSFLDNEREAYLSTFRSDSYGDLDIYKITYNDKEAKQSVLQVKTFAGDTSKVQSGVIITVNSLPGNNEYGSYRSKKNGGAAIVLDAGKYNVIAEADGFKPYSKEVTVDNKKLYTEKMPFFIILEPLAAAKPDKSKNPKKKEGGKTEKPASGAKNGKN